MKVTKQLKQILSLIQIEIEDKDKHTFYCQLEREKVKIFNSEKHFKTITLKTLIESKEWSFSNRTLNLISVVKECHQQYDLMMDIIKEKLINNPNDEYALDIMSKYQGEINGCTT